MGIAVGIDLGTTFSAVAIIDQETGLPSIVKNSEGEKTTPSVIYFADGRERYGTDAKDAFSSGDKNCAAFFKRNMGLHKSYVSLDGKDYTAEELSGLLLKHLKSDAESVLGTTIDEAVITVPAYFYSKEKEATMEAARFAGLKVKKIINEPTAAVIAYGLDHWRTNANIMVFDLGGGTFDVTLVRMDENQTLRTIGTTGNKFLGGVDWDQRMGNLINERILEQTRFDTSSDDKFKDYIKGSAEQCKKQLSQKPSAKLSLSVPDYGNITIEITREEFDNATVDLLDQTGVMCDAVLKEAGISWNDVSDVLLVGGSTRMLQVRDYIEKVAGKAPILHVNPDEAVALGAAVQTTLADAQYAVLKVFNKKSAVDPSQNRLVKKAEPAKKLAANCISKIILNEVTTHPMGIIAVNEEGTEYINELIIPANHPIPVRSARSFKFFTSQYGDNELEIFVLQGDQHPLECEIPYKYVVTGIKHEGKGETVIRIQYSYDQNGIIHVQARQGKASSDLPIRIESVPEDMSMYGKPIDKKLMQQLEQLSVAMAIDVSGSMSGTPMEQAQAAMCNFVRNMNFGHTQVGVIAVSDESKSIGKLTRDSGDCTKNIMSLICGQTGYGNSAHPFDTIIEMLKSEKGKRVAIVLADGMWSNEDFAISAAKRCNESGIETFAVGFGTVNQKFLDAISSTTENALLVSQSELSQTFGKIAQTLNTQNTKGSTRFNKHSDTEVWDIN